MARFLYQARDGHGEPLRGVVAAATMEEAGRLLRADGKFVVNLKEVAEADFDDGALSLTQRARRVRRQDVIYFAHQLAVMIDTGVPISEALESITQQAPNANFREIVRDITTQVESGNEFSSALRKYPKVFPPVMISLVRAAEVSGTLGAMLDKISEYLTKEQRIAKQIKGALIYPGIMVFMTITVTVFLLTFVLPQYKTVFESRGAALPAPTQLLLSASDLLINHWPIWLGVAGGSLFGLLVFRRTPPGRRMVDWLKLNAPLFRFLFTQLYITRSCRTLGTMVSAGVPMLDAVGITRDVTCNVYYEQLWDEVDDNLRQGLQLSDPLFRSELLPRSIVQMIRSGEKSGRLGHVLDRIAVHTEEEFDRAVKNATTLIEPAMIVLMGSIIGFVAISLLLPIFSVSKVVAG